MLHAWEWDVFVNDAEASIAQGDVSLLGRDSQILLHCIVFMAGYAVAYFILRPVKQEGRVLHLHATVGLHLVDSGDCYL